MLVSVSCNRIYRIFRAQHILHRGDHSFGKQGISDLIHSNINWINY